jgi:hypothetical protein
MSKIKIGNFELIEITDKKKGLKIVNLEERKARRDSEKNEKQAEKAQREEEFPQVEYRENLYNLSFGGLKDQSPFRFYQDEYDAYLAANPTDIFGDLSDVNAAPYNELRDSVRQELEARRSSFDTVADISRTRAENKFQLAAFELGQETGFDVSQAVPEKKGILYEQKALDTIGAGFIETSILTPNDVTIIWEASETDDIDETAYSEEIIANARKERDRYTSIIAELNESGNIGKLTDLFAEWKVQLDGGATEESLKADILERIEEDSKKLDDTLGEYSDAVSNAPFDSELAAKEITDLGDNIVSLDEEILELSDTIERRQFKQDERTFNQEVLTENLATEGEREFADTLINIPFAEDVYAATAANEISGERLKPAILKAVSEGRFFIRVSYLTKQEVYAFLQRGYRIIETSDRDKKDGKSDENPDNDYIVSWQVTDLHNGSDERVADDWGIKLPEAYWGSKS